LLDVFLIVEPGCRNLAYAVDRRQISHFSGEGLQTSDVHLSQDSACNCLRRDVCDERVKVQKRGVADERWNDIAALLNTHELLHGFVLLFD
jgi:hypothetical protein